MSSSTDTLDSAAEETAHVRVWDAPVRLVHWLNVALLAVLIATGLAGGDWLAWHMRAGQLLLALVVFRIAWGFVGSRNARFATFVDGPRAVMRYARSLVRPPHETHASHNPLGGWMVVLLLVAMLVQATTGLFANDDVLWEGPLAQRVSKDVSDGISSIHRQLWWLLVALASTHVAAAIAYVVALRQDLVRAMVTGRKRLPRGLADPSHGETPVVRALVVMAASAVAVWWGIYRL